MVEILFKTPKVTFILSKDNGKIQNGNTCKNFDFLNPLIMTLKSKKMYSQNYNLIFYHRFAQIYAQIKIIIFCCCCYLKPSIIGFAIV